MPQITVGVKEKWQPYLGDLSIIISVRYHTHTHTHTPKHKHAYTVEKEKSKDYCKADSEQRVLFFHNNISAVEPPLTATSPQRPLFCPGGQSIC